MNLYVIKSPQGDRVGDQFCPGFCSSLKWKQMLIHNCPPPPSCLLKVVISPGASWCVLANGAKRDGRRRGVWISLSSEGIDRYWGYRTVMWMLIQHVKVFRLHSCQTETRTWALIDCIMASLATMYSAHFLQYWCQNTTVIKMQIQVSQSGVRSFNPLCLGAVKHHQSLQHRKKCLFNK